MLLDRYFDDLFHRPAPRIHEALRASPLAEWRVPSRLVRYGIIYGGSAKDALAEFEPKFDPMMKRQAELMVEKLQAFIECCEAYEEATIEGPSEEDDAKAQAKAKDNAAV